MIKAFSATEFDSLKDIWESLETGSEMTCFQRYRWYKLVNRHFLNEKAKAPFRSGVYAVCYKNDIPVMIAPVQVVKKSVYFKGAGLRKGFYLIGRQGYSDYLNFIYKSFDNDAFIEILQWLKDTYKLDTFLFENIVSTSSIAAEIKKLNPFIESSSLCMALNTPGSSEEYNKLLSKSTRQNLRTAKNRAIKDGYSFHWEISENISPEEAKELNRVRDMRLDSKKKAAFSQLSLPGKLYTGARNLIVDIFNDKWDIFTEAEDKWCLTVYHQQQVAAFFFGIFDKEKQTVSLILAGTNPKFEHYSPGTVGLYEYLCEKMDSDSPESVKVFDFTRGNEDYKYKFKAQEIDTKYFGFNI